MRGWIERARAAGSGGLSFVVGFACCAVLARFLAATPVQATSAGNFRPASTAEVVALVDESVISLEAFPARSPGPADDFWPRLLGDSTPAGEPNSVASGVIVSGDGYVVTNNHVVDGAGTMRARLVDGREFSARVVGRDPDTDLAVLKIPARGLRAARMGDSRRVRAGDSVVAIGNPLGFENSVSVGIISANRKGPLRVDGRILGDVIQTDAAINQGNSGGGLFGADGRLIGINSAIMVPRGGAGNIGIGFAIPVHRVRPVMDSLILRGRVSRPWLGIKYHLPNPGSLVRRARRGAGLLVEGVVPGSPAAAAGLRPADVLRQLGDAPVGAPDDLFQFVEEHRPGQRVTARLLRNGEERQVVLTLRERPSPQ